MASCRWRLISLRFVVCAIITLIVTNCSRGARLPINVRVSSVKIIIFPKTDEENSLVPKISVGSFSQMILMGENLVEGLRATLTKSPGFEGEYCHPESMVSPVLKSHDFESVNKSSSVDLLLPSSVTKNFSELKDVWVCLGPEGSSSSELSNMYQKPLWIHQGEASKIHIVNREKQSYSSPNFEPNSFSSVFKKFARKISKRSSFERFPRSVEPDSEPPDSFHEGGTYVETLNHQPVREEKSSFKNDTSEMGRTTSDFESVLNRGFRTSSGGNVIVPTVDVSYKQNSTNSLSELKSNLDNVTEFLYDLLKDDLSVQNSRSRQGRDIDDALSGNSLSSEPTVVLPFQSKVRVYGIRVESHAKGISYEDGTIQLQSDNDAEIRLFGMGLTKDVSVQFTAREDNFGGRCDVSTSDVFQLETAHGHWAMMKIRLPVMSSSQRFWFICIREGPGGVSVHQGSEEWLTIATYPLLLPIWIQGIILVLLLILSGLFSGLNLGLMALDKTELKIVMNTGTPTERKYAKAIEPVRRHGNFLLCTLLLGNVLVNSSLTILLDTLSSGLVAVIGSTIGIVIFGEIVPQAICSRHGLAIGAKTVSLVRMFMVITGVVSWPISKLLDLILGEEIGNTYDRERLKELIRVTQDRNDLRLEEQNIIYGALELHRKTVGEVMTKLDDVFMLSLESNLDFNTINEIMEQGYSRIPIYDGEKTNIVSVLFIKDLAFIDPDDNTPLKTLSQFYQNILNFVFEDTTLDVIFKEFKEGNKGHMAFVQRVNSEGECDPFYEVIGLVTLEDVIEELIQEEIVDETDVFTDNKNKRRRKHIRKDFKEFSQVNQPNQRKVQISPHMQVAAFQFLRTSVEPFKEGQLSEGILKRMLNQDIIHVIKNKSSYIQQQNYVFVQGKPVDFFVLILEGHVEVTIGKENLTFESGPFTYFGLMALSMTPLGESPSLSTQMSRSSIVGSVQSLDSARCCFTPDYSVRATTEVTFLKVKRSHYIAARRANLLEQSQRDPLPEETFEKEMEKMLRDESLTSPVWENELNTEINVKDTLLNGGAVRSKDQNEVSDTADDRGLSLKEALSSLKPLIPPPNPNPPNPSGNPDSDPTDQLSGSSEDGSRSERRKNEKNSP